MMEYEATLRNKSVIGLLVGGTVPNYVRSTERRLQLVSTVLERALRWAILKT
jgi:hypothetical protein